MVVLAACTKKKNVNPPVGTTVSINGTAYPIVTIDSQTWTAVNYNGPGGVNYNDTSLNDPVFGKLYTYAETEAITLPVGWRLPTAADFNTLIKDISSEYPDAHTSRGLALALMSKSTWYGGLATNTTGFNAVAGGYFYSSANHYGFNGLGLDTEIWSTSLDANSFHESFDISFILNNPSAYVSTITAKSDDRGSVRFIKE